MALAYAAARRGLARRTQALLFLALAVQIVYLAVAIHQFSGDLDRFAPQRDPLAWTVQLVLGFGVTQAVCGVGSSRWGVGLDTWEIALMAAAGAVVVLAELSAVSLYLGTRDVPYDGPPPVGRRRFFVTASSL